jgi:preprotein translocase subunit SecD
MKKFRIFFTILILLGAFAIAYKVPTRLGLDLQGGMQLILEGQDTETKKADDDAILGAMEVIRNRIDSLGLTEPIIRRKGLNQIVIELPGIDDPQRAINLIGETALLEFVEGEWAPPGIENISEEKRLILTGKNAKIETIKEYDNDGNITNERPIILRETLLDGSLLESASPGTSQLGEPLVFIEFNKEGAEAFYRATIKNIGKPLAILLDGKIISAPNIREPIQGGRAQISGSFTIQEMRDLVIKLKAGALPIPMEIISKRIIGPSLGKDSIEKSKVAALIGLILVSIYMIFTYRLAGLMATIALFCYLAIALAILKGLGATLTLPGLAGLILTIGMAVDANVIIFERIKEERQKGIHILPSIHTGFNQAFITIVDANITTLIAATVLFWLGTGSIKGFAVTLSIGILVSMFSALFITKLLLQGIAKVFEKKENLIIKV